MRHTTIEFGKHCEPAIAEIINKLFYVGDCLVSLFSVEAVIEVRRSLSDLPAKRGFRLRKWLSNTQDVLETIPEADRSEVSIGHTFQDSDQKKLLGMLWKLKEGAFTFTVNLPPRPLTRRDILSALCSLFDPLGFVSPVILEGKIILQGLCRRKAG